MEPPDERRRGRSRGTEPDRARIAAQWLLALRRAARLTTESGGNAVTSEDAPADVNVIPLKRPPIRQSTVVRSDIQHTFDVFVDTIAQWWPLQPYSIGQDRVRDVVFERRPAGLIYEIWDDGHTVTWGRLLAWEPPTRFVMTWEILPAVTEVELTFRALGPGLTRVAVEHRGWEALTEEQLAAATTVEGGYSAGWAEILAVFARAAEATS